MVPCTDDQNQVQMLRHSVQIQFPNPLTELNMYTQNQKNTGFKRIPECIHERYYSIMQVEVAWLLAWCQTCLMSCVNK
jgi:hypothetical protein